MLLDARINPENGRLRVSKSFLEAWMKCSLSARFNYIDQMPRRQNAAASFGTVIHYCLEQYNKRAKRGPVDIEAIITLFDEYWNDPEKLDVAIDVWPRSTSFASYRVRGHAMLQGYHDKMVHRFDREVIATEYNFVIPFGQEFELTGVVDLLEADTTGNGTRVVRIVDFKTAKRKPLVNALKLDIQFTAYLYAASQPEFWAPFSNTLFGEADYLHLPHRGVWWHLETNGELDAGKRDDGDFQRLHRVCREIKRAVEAEVFIPHISADSCMLCDYTKPCGVPLDYDPSSDEERWF